MQTKMDTGRRPYGSQIHILIMYELTMVSEVVVERPTKHIIGHIGDGFYGSNDPTHSVKALKKNRVIRIRLQSHHRVTVIQHIMQYDKIDTKTQTFSAQ